MEPVKHPRFTKEYLINKLKELSDFLGHPPKYWDLKGVNRPRGVPGPSTFETYFGSWTKAMEAAGFTATGIRGGNKTGRKPLNDDFLIEKLQELFVSLGRTPKSNEVDLLSKQKKFFSASVYETHFGSWNKALMRAGIPTQFGGVERGSPAALAWGKKMAGIRRKDVLKNPFANLRMRFEIFRRDNFTCQYCGRTPQDGAKLVVDHILAVANGGKTRLDNLITSCFECNAGKSCLLLNGQQKMATGRLGSQ